MALSRLHNCATVDAIINTVAYNISTTEHLSDLEKSDIVSWVGLRHLFHGLQSKVGVHDGMHCVVHSDEEDAIGCFSDIAMPTEEKNRNDDTNEEILMASYAK